MTECTVHERRGEKEKENNTAMTLRVIQGDLACFKSEWPMDTSLGVSYNDLMVTDVASESITNRV